MIFNFVWGIPMLILLVGTGILMTLSTKVFQISHFGHWMKNTIGSIFTDRHITKHTGKEDKSISQFQSLCTALAATIGTGNIVGVASALITGGPGAMYYLRDGLGAKKYCKKIGLVLSVLFSVFCLLASFGIGNMSQINSIAVNMESAFNIPTLAPV